jgi:hypothetical protein
VCAQAQPGSGSSDAAVITDEAIAEVVAAFTAVAGEANAAQLQKLLSNIQQQQQAAATAATDAPGQQQQQQQQDAAALDLEVDLLPECNKDVRKVSWGRQAQPKATLCNANTSAAIHITLLQPLFLVMRCMSSLAQHVACRGLQHRSQHYFHLWSSVSSSCNSVCSACVISHLTITCREVVLSTADFTSALIACARRPSTSSSSRTLACLLWQQSRSLQRVQQQGRKGRYRTT